MEKNEQGKIMKVVPNKGFQPIVIQQQEKKVGKTIANIIAKMEDTKELKEEIS